MNGDTLKAARNNPDQNTPDPPSRPPWAPDEHPRLLFATDTALETARALAEERDLWSMGSSIEPVAEELVVSDRAVCLAHDADRDVLFGRDDGRRRFECDHTGLLGWVAHSGLAVRLDDVAGDSRFDPIVDDPNRAGAAADPDHEPSNQRPTPGPFLAVPIRGPSGPVLAVLAVLRTEGASPFTERDQRALEILAAEVYRPFEQLHRESILRQALERALPGAGGPPFSIASGADPLFRPEALKQHARGRADSGDVLRLMPSWTRAAYALLILAVAGLGIAASVLRVDRWLSAPAIVLGSDSSHQETEFASQTRGWVDRGRERACLSGSALGSEQAPPHQQLDPTHQRWREFGATTAGHPADPSEPASGQISDNAAAGLSIAALFPASDRSQLRPGQDLRLQLTDGTVLSLEIETISPQLMGPAAVRQTLGPDLSDAIPVTGTVAWIEASVDPELAGDLYPGWTGQAQVRAGSERVFDALWRGSRDD